MPAYSGERVLEVGCGAGAFLYPLWEQGHQVGGIDFAANLIEIARQVMPDADLAVGEAAALDPEARADVLVSNGVFLYFPSEDYAAAVLRKMVMAARRSVGVFDVADLAQRDQAIAARKATLGEAEYAIQYRGLDQLYLDRAWFARTLADLPVTVEVADQDMPGYGNARWRYNVYIRR